jgi:hypothetical protein
MWCEIFSPKMAILDQDTTVQAITYEIITSEIIKICQPWDAPVPRIANRLAAHEKIAVFLEIGQNHRK